MLHETCQPAYRYCIYLLARREYAQSELEHKLGQKGYDETIIQLCLNYLVTKDYQSDKRYAEMIVRTRIKQKYGARYIQQSLRQKEIAPHIITLCLDYQSDVWLENAIVLLEKKQRQGDFDQKTKEKLKRYLVSRGYSYEIIAKAFAEIVV